MCFPFSQLYAFIFDFILLVKVCAYKDTRQKHEGKHHSCVLSDSDSQTAKAYRTTEPAVQLVAVSILDTSKQGFQIVLKLFKSLCMH